VSFESLNLNKPLLNALTDLEYVYPTPIQHESFPIVMSGRDVVGIAQTGTGKTFAYLLPVLRQLSYSEQRDPRVLILVPTRELVIQVIAEIKKLTTYMTVRVAGVYGGTNINTQKAAVHAGLDILVATPGRMIDLAMNGVLKTKSIQKLIIDEVDEMLNLGFRTQIINLLETLIPKRQNLMFSATLTDDVEKLINEHFINPYKIEIAPHGTPLERIIQFAYHLPNIATKINLLELLLSEDENMSKVLVFANNKKLADRIHEHLNKKFAGRVGVTHSNKSHSVRLNALRKFKEDEYRVLIATDIIARGLDISDVSHVINFDISPVPGDYMHRIGRTGRANKDGIAISFVADYEHEFKQEIESLMKIKLTKILLPENLVISNLFTEDERPTNLYDKHYLKAPSIKTSQGAFHDKKEKNKKINLGGPSKRNPKHGKPKMNNTPPNKRK